MRYMRTASREVNLEPALGPMPWTIMFEKIWKLYRVPIKSLKPGLKGPFRGSSRVSTQSWIQLSWSGSLNGATQEGRAQPSYLFTWLLALWVCPPRSRACMDAVVGKHTQVQGGRYKGTGEQGAGVGVGAGAGAEVGVCLRGCIWTFASVVSIWKETRTNHWQWCTENDRWQMYDV